MSFLIALLVWLVVLGVCFSLAIYAINNVPAAQPFRGAAIAVLCIICILVLIGMVSGQVPMPGYVRTR